MINSSLNEQNRHKNSGTVFNFLQKTKTFKGFDDTYRNTTTEHTAVEDSWDAISDAVTAWKNDASTPTAWTTCLDALYGYAETNRNACSAAQKTLL